jgi:crossover junction endodeoxyribonuclease RuvC
MRILGIDPGYGRCGVAVVEKRPNHKEEVLYSNCIETSASLDFTARLHAVLTSVRTVCTEHQPTLLALEKLYFTKNQKTAMRVAEVRGALLGLASELGIPAVEYGPGEIKVAVTGDGRADKKQVAHMVSILVNMNNKKAHDDEFDAVAVALTALTSAT